jgi:DNA-binding LacI/PurR family transcriptional regulator
MEHERIVSLRDVAKAAGVGVATASRAMRDDPSTAAKTRDHVKAVAKEIGYRPDPAFSRMAERRWHGKHARDGLNLGFLYNPQGDSADKLEEDYQHYKQPAYDLGYSLIKVDLSHFTMLRGLTNRLEAQGIRGLILPLLPDIPFDINPLLGKYPAVSLGISAFEPECPTVMHDEFFCTRNAWKIIRKKGYQRVGFILPDYPESPSTNLRRAAALLCIQDTAKKDQIPIIFLSKGKEMDYEKFKNWQKKYRPDVLLSYTHDRVADFKYFGLNIPQDIPFATSGLWDMNEIENIAGYFRANTQLFEQGVELLNMMIRSGTPGSKRAGLVELVKGEWKDGKTLPVQS